MRESSYLMPNRRLRVHHSIFGSAAVLPVNFINELINLKCNASHSGWNASPRFCFLVMSGQVEGERQLLERKNRNLKNKPQSLSHTHTHRPLKHERVQRKRGIVRAVSGRTGKADSGRKALWVGSEWHRSLCRLCECQGREGGRGRGSVGRLWMFESGHMVAQLAGCHRLYPACISEPVRAADTKQVLDKL